MPRYYFNVRFGPGSEHLAVDPEGDDLPDLDAARDHALSIARDLIARTQLSAIRDWFSCSFEIEDEHARALLTVSFSETRSDGPHQSPLDPLCDLEQRTPGAGRIWHP